MARWRCNSCGGEYEDLLPDNTQYFHACPMVVIYRVKWEDGTEATVEHPLPKDAVMLTQRIGRRSNHRDENIHPGRPYSEQDRKLIEEGRTLIEEGEKKEE